jgi:hypothetical protein
MCLDIGRNSIHGSDSIEAATREIALWFSPEEIINWGSCQQKWVNEDKEKNEDGHELEDDWTFWYVYTMSHNEKKKQLKKGKKGR